MQVALKWAMTLMLMAGVGGCCPRSPSSPASPIREPLAEFDSAEQALARGDRVTATEKLLWFLDHAHEFDPALGGLQHVAVGKLGELAQVNYVAHEELAARRDRLEQRILAGDDVVRVGVYHSINCALAEPQRTLGTFRRASRSRQAEMLPEVLEELLSSREYELLGTHKELLLEQLAADGEEVGYAVERVRSTAAIAFEVLVSLGDEPGAESVGKNLLAVDPTSDARTVLAQSGERSMRPELARRILARGAETADGMDRNRMERNQVSGEGEEDGPTRDGP